MKLCTVVSRCFFFSIVAMAACPAAHSENIKYPSKKNLLPNQKIGGNYSPSTNDDYSPQIESEIVYEPQIWETQEADDFLPQPIFSQRLSVTAAKKSDLPKLSVDQVNEAENKEVMGEKSRETKPNLNNEVVVETTKLPPLKGDILKTRPPVLTSADQLQQGEMVSFLRYRQSFPPGDAAKNGVTGRPTLGFSWGVNDNLELTLDAQTVDNSDPVQQGPFLASRTTEDGSGNFFQELTLQLKQRLWENAEGSQALSGVFAVSRGSRSYRFFDANGNPLDGGTNKNEMVVSVETPFTFSSGDKWQFTLSPKVALLPKDNALYYRRMPVEDGGDFGTVFGIAGGASYQLNSRLILWGDAFIPLTGHNTISRDTGLPARVIGFNAGLRYLVNPRLATDLFISNTLGNTGALSIITDKEYISAGLGVTFLPGFAGANRQYRQHFSSVDEPRPFTPAGFAFFDGGTVAPQQLLTTLQAGSQGWLVGLRYGILDDLEVGFFLDYILGIVDESELGVSGKIRFLQQGDGAPFTLSAVLSAARSNNVMLNFINGNGEEFKQRNLDKRGFALSKESCSEQAKISAADGNDGDCLILTLSLPAHYQFKNGSAIWLTPTLGYVQRNGIEIAGLMLGGSIPLSDNLHLIGEAGLNITSSGNALIGNNRENVIPWSVGLRWNAASLLGIKPATNSPGPQLEVYLTNRVGSSPFHSLRVREDNHLGLGVGLVVPLQF